MIQNVKENLRRVRCYHSATLLESVIAYAQQNDLSYLTFLEYLLEQECLHRNQTAINRNTRTCGFPQIKTFDEFDFNYQHDINKKLIAEWKTFDWVDQRCNKIFMGPPGVGKTHIAIALSYEALKVGYKVIFFTMNNLMDEMLLASYNNEFKRWLKKIAKFDIVVIDEIGYLPVKTENANLFFMLIDELYEFRSVIITSNKLFKKWGSTFGDSIVSSAIIDRIIHHSETIVINGDSYRMKGKIKK